jgi:hypothetical protein
MIHYIPTDYFFNDLIEKIEWAKVSESLDASPQCESTLYKAHDDQAKEIMRQANQWALEYLSFSAVLAFVEILLGEYALLLQQPISVHREAIKVSFQ